MLFKVISDFDGNDDFEIEAESEEEAYRIALQELGWYIVHSTKNNASWCTNCGGEMTWCEVCQMWSAFCCEEYGSCGCS